MNPQDPLANLHPLREPALIGWWPPAPGWWLLCGLVLLALVLAAWFLLRRHRANAYRRRALRQLTHLQEAFLESRDASAYIAGINALLKSVALHAYPQRETAAISGVQWLTFLGDTNHRSANFPPGFATAAYHKDCPDIDMEQAAKAARSWISGHEVSR